jgi:peroxiredoxin
MTRLIEDMPAPRCTVSSISDTRIQLPQPGLWMFVSFLRYASCPACNLRVRELRAGTGELRSAGIEWLVVFHSPDWRLKRHMPADVWSNVIADPESQLSSRFGTTRSWLGVGLSMVLPAFYWAYLKTLAFGFWGGAVHSRFDAMPADFLIGPDGTIRLAHYGRHIVDHVDVASVLDFVRRHPTAVGPHADRAMIR